MYYRDLIGFDLEVRLWRNNPAATAGLTVVELLIAVAIMTAVMALAYDQVLTLNNLGRRIEAQSAARAEAKLLSDYMGGLIRQVGGVFIHPSIAILVEDDCDHRGDFANCLGSDRMTYAVIDRNFDFCTVLSASAPRRLHFDPSQSACCAETMRGRQITLVLNQNFSHSYVEDSAFDEGAGICWLEISPGQLSPLNAGNEPAPPWQWTGANMAVMSVATLYLDTDTNELRRFADKNNDAMMDADEVETLSDQVLDLQFLMGFDRPPEDGRIDNLNSDQDEWLGNALGPNESLDRGGLTGVPRSNLRMIAVGIMTFHGRGAGGSTSEVRVFNGPDRGALMNGLVKTVSERRLYLRSSMIFND